MRSYSNVNMDQVHYTDLKPVFALAISLTRITRGFLGIELLRKNETLCTSHWIRIMALIHKHMDSPREVTKVWKSGTTLLFCAHHFLFDVVLIT